MKPWDIYTFDFPDAGPDPAVIVSHPDRVTKVPNIQNMKILAGMIKKLMFALSLSVLGLVSARAGDVSTQPELSANDLAWYSGVQYAKAFCEAADPDRPHTLRLILQTKGAPDVRARSQARPTGFLEGETD